MDSVSDLLMNTLDDLVKGQMRMFNRDLTTGVSGFERISKSRLEDAERQDTVDVLLQTYLDDGAVKITQIILKRMGNYDLAEKLRKSYESMMMQSSSPDGDTNSTQAGASTPGQHTNSTQAEASTPAQHTNSTQAGASTPAQHTNSAEGGKITAPVFSGISFQGPVNMTFN